MFTTDTASDYADLLDRLHTFLTAKGSAFGLTYAGTGDGTLTAYSGGASSVAETFTITATSSTSFNVVGSVSGSIGPATVGTPFAHAKIEFLISAGGTAFVAGDEFELATAPPWTSKRKALGCRVTATQGNAGPFGVQNIVDGKKVVSTQCWQVTSPVTVPQDVEVEFFEAETIETYQMGALMSSYYSSLPYAWTLQYWDGDSWEDLDTQSGHNDWTEEVVKTFEISSPVSATKYRLHITETNSSSRLRLGLLRLLRTDGVDAAFSQTIWEAPGNDGDSEILVGVHLFERQDADYFNWEIGAFDAFAAGTQWRDQAGHHSRLYLPLWDESIPYWFIADGRHVIVVAKLNTQYEVAYLGLIDSYFSPSQWPYPIALGGSLAFEAEIPDWDDDAWRWSNASLQHRAFTHSDPGDGDNDDVGSYQMRARDLSGGWYGFAGLWNDNGCSGSSGMNLIWPYCCGLELLDANRDGGYLLLPVMLMAQTPNTLGELAGVACVTGQGLTDETLIQDGALDWIVFHDTFRTDRDDFFAVKLD